MKQFILLFITIPFLIFSQSGKLKKADNFYDKISYYDAIPLYEELLGSEVDSPELKSKLAFCYMQVGNLIESEKMYQEIVKSNVSSNLDIYYFSSVLKQNGKYSESDYYMKKFHSIVKNDTRAIEFIENENYIEKIEKSGNKFSIKNLNLNSENSDFGAYLFKNKAFVISTLKISKSVKRYWAWNNKFFLDMYIADVDTSQELTNLKLMTKRVNTKFHEGPVCFSPDGKKVYFTRNNISSGTDRRDEEGIQNLKLYIADVVQENIWVSEREFIYNSKDFSIGHPTITADGKYLYFASDMPGGFGGADIYRVEILNDGKFSKPENLGTPINTEGHDMFPHISNENLLFFSSNGHVGLGGLDVFVGLPDQNKKYSKILNVGKPVNSLRDDFAFIIDSTSRKGYFSSNRVEGKGDDDIYSFRLDKPFKAGLILKGIVYDKDTKQLLANSLVQLRNEKYEIIASMNTNEKGEYEFLIDENKDYNLIVDNEKYYNFNTEITSKNLANTVTEIIRDVPLSKIPEISLYCLVLDTETKVPLEGVSIKVLDLNTQNLFIDVKTGEYGDFFRELLTAKVGDELDYKITIQKEGYVTKVHLFSYTIQRPGKINLHEFLDFTIGKPKVGTDLATLIDLKPIYFDLGKFVIRKDAAIELDKIVQIMNEYPSMVVELGSHTDCRSSKAFNMKLSDKRAKASAKYIKARIKKPERIFGKGYGESKLKNDCGCEGKIVTRNCSELEHQENRRTEFIIKKIGADNVKVKETVYEKPKLEIDTTKMFHIVEDNENLYMISVNNGVSVDEIKRLNNLSSDKVTKGQKLILRL
jgi:outer membrane protein OmpA-like peptidoglycan-associated protein